MLALLSASVHLMAYKFSIEVVCLITRMKLNNTYYSRAFAQAHCNNEAAAAASRARDALKIHETFPIYGINEHARAHARQREMES